MSADQSSPVTPTRHPPTVPNGHPPALIPPGGLPNPGSLRRGPPPAVPSRTVSVSGAIDRRPAPVPPPPQQQQQQLQGGSASPLASRPPPRIPPPRPSSLTAPLSGPPQSPTKPPPGFIPASGCDSPSARMSLPNTAIGPPPPAGTDDIPPPACPPPPVGAAPPSPIVPHRPFGRTVSAAVVPNARPPPPTPLAQSQPIHVQSQRITPSSSLSTPHLVPPPPPSSLASSASSSSVTSSRSLEDVPPPPIPQDVQSPPPPPPPIEEAHAPEETPVFQVAPEISIVEPPLPPQSTTAAATSAIPAPIPVTAAPTEQPTPIAAQTSGRLSGHPLFAPAQKDFEKRGASPVMVGSQRDHPTPSPFVAEEDAYSIGTEAEDAATIAAATSPDEVAAVPSPSPARHSTQQQQQQQQTEDFTVEAFKVAIEMEDDLLAALGCLNDNYRQPLQARLGKLASADLDVIFKDMEALITASLDLSKRLRETASQLCNQDAWLACVYAAGSNSPNGYIPAYKRFITSHNEGIIRLNTLKTSNRAFMQALAACTAPSERFPNCEIEDLFWMVCSRVRYVAQIAQAQRNYRHGSEELVGALSTADTFSQRYRPAAEAVPWVRARRVEDTRKVDDAISQLGDLQATAVMLDELHAGLGVVRMIRAAAEDIPASVTRKLMEQTEVVVQSKTEFGLSTEVPAFLMFFSDAVALCLGLPPGERHRYQLLQWYKVSQLWVADTQAKTKEPTFRLAQKVMSTAETLPPGWEEVVKSNKRSFVNKTLGLTQQQRPERISLCDSIRDILAPNNDVKAVILARLKELTGADPQPEVKYPPYVIVGSNLDPLMTHEQSLVPGITVPLLVKKICHHIISYGLGEQGIFRVAGEKRYLEELRNQVNSGHMDEIKFEQQNINLVSGLLKLFLREMPLPLLPSELYSSFVVIPGMPEKQQISELVKLIDKLPVFNRDLLRELLSFEFQIACNEHVNSMNSKNLAIVTSPNILRRADGQENMLEMTQCNDVVAIMIDRFLELFEASDSIPRSPSAAALSQWVSFKRKLLGHNKGIRMLIQSADKERVLSVDGDGATFVWSANKCRFQEQVAIQVKYPNCAILVGENFWIGSQQGIFIYNSGTNALVGQVPNIVATSLLLVGTTEVWVGTEGKIVVVSATSLAPVAELPEKNASTIVFCLALVGEHIWSAGYCKAKEQEVIVWDRFTRRRVTNFVAHKKRINALAVSGNTVWSCSDDFSICVWHATRHNRLATLERHGGAVYGFCVLADQVWSCSWDKTIMIWEPNTFRYLGEIKGYHTDSVCSLIPVRRGNNVDIWSGSFDKALCVWSVRNAPTVNALR